MIIYIIIAAVMVGIDFAVKAWVVANIPLNGFHELIPGVIGMTHIKNTGAAWSMFEGAQWFFYIATIIALGVVVYLWRDSKGKPVYRLGLALVTAGALGNFIDRLHQQYVTDMFQLEFANFPIFNVADVCLTVGVICVLVQMIILDRGKD